MNAQEEKKERKHDEGRRQIIYAYCRPLESNPKSNRQAYPRGYITSRLQQSLLSAALTCPLFDVSEVSPVVFV